MNISKISTTCFLIWSFLISSQNICLADGKLEEIMSTLHDNSTFSEFWKKKDDFENRDNFIKMDLSRAVLENLVFTAYFGIQLSVATMCIESLTSTETTKRSHSSVSQSRVRQSSSYTHRNLKFKKGLHSLYKMT